MVIFGIILAFIAYFFSHFEKFLWLAFKIGGVTYGSLLGVFLLGFLTKRRCNRVNVVAMTLSALGMLVLLILSEKKIIPLGWTWLLLMGTFLTFMSGWLFGKKGQPPWKARVVFENQHLGGKPETRLSGWKCFAGTFPTQGF